MSESWSSRVRSSNAFTITAVCIGLFTDSITACSIIPILPSALVTRAHVPEEHVQYYIALFMASFSISFFIAAPIFGYVSDRLTSKRWPFVFGMVANILSLLLFLKATSIVGMTIARALQGLSSSVISVIGTGMIKEKVSEEETGKGMAFTSLAIQLGLISGPTVGGLVYDNIGYEAVFLGPAILLGLDIVLRLLIIDDPVLRPKASHPESASFNGEHGHEAETASLMASSSPSYIQYSSSTQILGAQESESKTIMERFPVLHLFLNGRMLTALFVSMLDSISWCAMESTVPLFVERTFHWTPTRAGALFLISCTPGIILSYIMGMLIDRAGSFYPTAIGLFVAAACHLAQRLVVSNAMLDKILLATLFTITNIFMLFVQITMSAEIGIAAKQVDDSLKGQAGRMVGKGYAFYMMAQVFGAFLGPVVGGAMIETAGWAGMTTLLGALFLSALPCVFVFTGGGIFDQRSDRKGNSNHETDVHIPFAV